MALYVQKLMLESVHIFNGGFKQKLKNETVSVDIVIHFGWNNLFRRIRAMNSKEQKGLFFRGSEPIQRENCTQPNKQNIFAEMVCLLEEKN